MKKRTPILCAASIALMNLAGFFPTLAFPAEIVAGSSIALSLVIILWASTVSIVSGQASAPLKVEAPVPTAPTQSAEAELITLLGLMQEKGRFVDFLMEDITVYDDAQVGSVARIVHQGCSEVISQHFEVQPIANVQEGAPITVPAGYSPTEFRLIGKIGGQPPFTGTLVHKGWKTASVKLPRVVKSEGGLPSIAPAEVELK